MNIWLYNARGQCNVIAVVAGDQYCLVGAGGSNAGAIAAKTALAAAIPDFDTLTLNSILIPDDDPKTVKGGLVWINGDATIPVYVHANWVVSKCRRECR